MNINKLLTQIRENPTFKKYDIYIAPTISALLVLLMAFLVIVPNIFQYFDTATKIKETTEKSAFYAQKAKALQAIKKDQYKDGLSASFSILPNDKEAPSAIGQLYYLVNSTNINLQNIAFSEGSVNNHKTFRMNLELTGNLTSLTNFIIHLKEAPRIMQISSLEVSSQRGSDNIFATILLDAYYEPLTSTAVSSDQALTIPTAKDLELLSKVSTTTYPVVSESVNYTGEKGKPDPFH